MRDMAHCHLASRKRKESVASARPHCPEQCGAVCPGLAAANRRRPWGGRTGGSPRQAMAEWVATLSERAPTADIAALRSWPADIQAGARLLYSSSTSAGKGAAGRRAARRRTSRRRTSSKTCHRAGVWRKLFSSPIGAIDEMRFVVRSLGTISAICQRARRRHRRSARLVCGTAPGRQAAHVSQSSRVVRRIRGAGCRARPRWASEAKRRGRSRSRAAHKGLRAFLHDAFRAVRRRGWCGARRDLPLLRRPNVRAATVGCLA